MEAIIHSRGRAITTTAGNLARIDWNPAEFAGRHDRGPRGRVTAELRDRVHVHVLRRTIFVMGQR